MFPKKSTVTFVTAFMNIYDTPLHNIRDVSWRFNHFSKIAETGVPICVYVDQMGEDYMKQFVELFPDNVRIMRVMNIRDTWIHKECQNSESKLGHPIIMPETRTITKDTYEYMVLMNSKIEFMADTIEKNPWNTTHFAWIDFNIWHIFKDHEGSACQIQNIAYSKYGKNREFITIPGCWAILSKEESIIPNVILNQIHWRFCGGFFLGTNTEILHLWNLYKKFWPYFLEKYNGHIVWEVNFWSWLEVFSGDWSPFWFSADHDERIIDVPIELMSTCLARDISTTDIKLYPYKEIPGYHPMSASVYVSKDSKTRILNTRYVNYRLTEHGAYIFYDPNHIIASKNVFSILDQEWVPVNYQEMEDPKPNDLPSKQIPPCLFDGIEDIRIFSQNFDKGMNFLGTSINYSNMGSNRMIYGNYDINNYSLKDCYLLEPPYDSYCEKNWSPIMNNQENSPIQIIYKWCPLEIGKLVDLEPTDCGHKRKKLDIQIRHCIHAPIFRRFRGSSIFTESILFPGYFIGVVHFSINEWPRNYYNSIVLLDKKTMKPKAYTPIFTFCDYKSVEFCIGFSETLDNKFNFWISRFDRDPALVICPIEEFSWCEL